MISETGHKESYQEIESDLLEYFSRLPEVAGPSVTLGAGTAYELRIPAQLLPIMEEVYGTAPLAIEAVLEVRRRQICDRDRRVAGMLVKIFEDDEESGLMT